MGACHSCDCDDSCSGTNKNEFKVGVSPVGHDAFTSIKGSGYTLTTGTLTTGYTTVSMKVENTTRVYKTGARYVGQMSVESNPAMRHGYGKFTYASPPDAVYEGQWQFDQSCGKGIFRDSKSEYNGQWHGGRKHGYGEEKWFEDSTIYKGTFDNGEKHGEGRYQWGDGSRYIGQFSRDEICGYGTYTDIDGEYVGQFRDSANHGKGIYRGTDGSIYEGQWAFGEKDGQGTLTWPDGRKYVGQWLGDAQHGSGKFHKKDKNNTIVEVHFYKGKKLKSLDEFQKIIKENGDHDDISIRKRHQLEKDTNTKKKVPLTVGSSAHELG